MTQKIIDRVLIALEDLFIGQTTTVQTRASGSQTVNGINASDLGSKTASETDLLDATSTVNTVRKTLGEPVWDSTNNKPLWANGTTAVAVWVDATGATVHTPV